MWRRKKDMFEALFGVYLFLFGGVLSYLHNNANHGTNGHIKDDSNSSLKILKRVRRIVGGDVASIEDVPFLVNIRRDGIFECGGALITPDCVITAAHCIKNSKPENFVIRAGVTYLTDKRNSRYVDKIFKPIYYNNKSFDYDVAIFKLKSEFGNIETIKLADARTRLTANTIVTISGWGLTSETSIVPSNRMRTAQVRVLSQEQCRSLYHDYRNVTERMFCASLPGLRDACSADSGGPAVVNGKLVGIVSWGKGYECARAESPGVYVNIAAMRPWIDNVMENECLSDFY